MKTYRSAPAFPCMEKNANILVHTTILAQKRECKCAGPHQPCVEERMKTYGSPPALPCMDKRMKICCSKPVFPRMDKRILNVRVNSSHSSHGTHASLVQPFLAWKKEWKHTCPHQSFLTQTREWKHAGPHHIMWWNWKDKKLHTFKHLMKKKKWQLEGNLPRH